MSVGNTSNVKFLNKEIFGNINHPTVVDGYCVPFSLSATDTGINVTVGKAENERSLTLDDEIDSVEQLFTSVFMIEGLQDIVKQNRTPLKYDLEVKNMFSDVIQTDLSRQLISRIDSFNLLLTGSSASGKSFATYFAAATMYNRGWNTVWANFADSNTDCIDVVLALLNLKRRTSKDVLIVFDNVQSNFNEAKRSYDAAKAISQYSACKFHFVLIGWNSISKMRDDIDADLFSIASNGENAIRSVIEKKLNKELRRDQSIISNIYLLAQGDVLIATLSIEHYNATQNTPTLMDLSVKALDEVHIDNSSITRFGDVLYRCASLGLYEIDMSESYLQEYSSTDTINLLLEKQVLRKSGDYISIGHRSLCNLIAYFLRAKQFVNEDMLSSIKIATTYLEERADRKQILATLERLDIVSLQSSEGSEASTLVDAWTAFQSLSEYINTYTQNDSSWGNNTSAAVFAADALALNDQKAWYDIARFIRETWIVNNENMLPTQTRATLERDDFDLIFSCMQEEDANFRSAGQDIIFSAESIDLDRMHKTWVLGLLLGFEGNALSPESNRVSILKTMAENAQLPSGAFYPERVPWITARVVIGLGLCGENYLNSKVVRDASNWLRRQHPVGAFRGDRWESGTGTWNTSLQTTLMCLSALIGAHVSITSPHIQKGYVYLLNNNSEWTTSGAEIDAVLALDTMLSINFELDSLSNSSIKNIIQWVSQQQIWSLEAFDSRMTNDESCKIPYVASNLLSIIWKIVSMNFAKILEGTPNYQNNLESEDKSERSLVTTTPIVGTQDTILKGTTKETLTSKIAALRANIIAEQKPGDHIYRPDFNSIVAAIIEQLDCLQNGLAIHNYDADVSKINDEFFAISTTWIALDRGK